METRPGDPKHGDLARGGVRQRTLESDAEAYSFTFGWSGYGDG
jgi:hypothetical protein